MRDDLLNLLCVKQRALLRRRGKRGPLESMFAAGTRQDALIARSGGETRVS
jgi:hypothetical protein